MARISVLPSAAAVIVLGLTATAAQAATAYNVISWPGQQMVCKRMVAASPWNAWVACMNALGINENAQTGVITTAPSCHSVNMIVPQDGSGAYRWAFDRRFATSTPTCP
jgi:hypothetical protein